MTLLSGLNSELHNNVSEENRVRHELVDKAESYLTDFIDTANSQLNEDCFNSVPEIITRYGYPCESSEVKTSDGFLLTLHRMPRPNGIPVLLQHGFQGDSGNFVHGGPDDGLGFGLYDMGFDAYLGNGRGNTYSRKHQTMSPEDDTFWHWSFQEIASKFGLLGSVKVP